MLTTLYIILAFYLSFNSISTTLESSKRWTLDDLLQLSGDAMHYVMIEERLVESLRMKWEDAKRRNLEYYIANVNPECWSQYKARMPIDRIQSYSLPI